MTSSQSFTATHLWRMRRVGRPEPAPDGSFVIVPVTTYDIDENRGTTRLYRVGLDTEPQPLTSGERTVSGTAVSPDGSRLAFLAKPVEDDEAVPQLYLLPLDGGESDCVTDLPLGVLDVRWLPDGSGVVLMSEVFKDALTIEAAAERRKELKESKVSAKTTEDRVYRFWTRWLTDGAVPHLFHLDLATRELTDLTPGSRRWMYFMEPAGGFDISPDGTEVAFGADVSEQPHARPQLAVFTAPLNGSGETQLTAELPAQQTRPRYSPDGRHLLYGIQRDWAFYADRVRLVAFDRSTGTEQVLTEDWDRSASDWEFAATGDIVFAAEDDARVNLYTMTLEEGVPLLLVQGGSAGGPRPAADGSVYYLMHSLVAPPEVHRIDPSGTIDQITNVNADVLGEVALGEVRDIRYPGANGDEVQAFLVLPAVFDEARKWPLVHAIHGGPHGTFGDAWHWRWSAQALAASGYVVAMVNFHGSTSWGQDFAQRIQGAWGAEPAADVNAATDYLIRQGFVDPDRIAIAGGSYGGYLTTWLMGHTDRYAAAIVHAGVTNMLGQYASDITAGRERAMGGNAWESIDVVHQWSPNHHASGFSTPTLVIHGEKDYRVVVTQGLELYGILQAKGIDSRLVYYPDEGHWILKPQNSLHWYGEVLAWLDRFLK
ncbi:MAG: S9 family peptidase [Acidimicrobiia bacterium]|nr:S9 family peptidase [Acidimicrobiia bacterium]